MSDAHPLRQSAITIWRAAVDAVDSQRLVANAVRWANRTLFVKDRPYPLAADGRVVVVGAGKAGAGMAAGLEQALAGTEAAKRLSGWVNVPADCVRPLTQIHLHPARPAGRNEPTDEGVAGATAILQLARSLRPDDLGIVLLSGGGSALLPAPIDGVSLADKQAVTRYLMNAGAAIEELNCVRKHLSKVKGGRLAEAAPPGARLISLIISDVVGDPLDVIASGPTAFDPSNAADALGVLGRFDPQRKVVSPSVWSALESAAEAPRRITPLSAVDNIVIGNNAIALHAAAQQAATLGYQVQSLGSDNRGVAHDVGRELARLCRSIRDNPGAARPVCVLSGGEPTVRLVKTDRPRRGGRNQELVLSAVDQLWDDGMSRIAILSGGTDGEDGPTDAAGAVADSDIIAAARRLGLSPEPFLEINDSYSFFEAASGLLKTGPTHTNVMDVRVALVMPNSDEFQPGVSAARRFMRSNST